MILALLLCCVAWTPAESARLRAWEMTLGTRIRQLREKRGITLRGLAAIVGLSPPFMSDLEHDRRNTEKLPQIAKALGVPLRDLEKRVGRLDRATLRWLEKHPEIAQTLRDRMRRDLIG